METKVIITFDVARTIIKSSAKFDVETGGILAGTLAEPITIVAAGEPGAGAVHNAAYFTTDPAADRSCLEQARSIYGSAIELVGWWHKHPLGFDRPSSGDIHQAHQLTSEFNDGKPVLMGIVNRKSGILASSTTLQIYSIDSKNNLIKHNWGLVSRRNQKLLKAICEAPARPQVKDSNYWSDKDFQSYLNPIGRDRIKQEIESLKEADWQVKVGRLKHNGLLTLDVFDGLNELRFVLPPEFPLNPPTLFTSDGRYFQGLEVLNQWNSTSRLAKVAEDAASIICCQHCSRLHLATVQD